jgi:hypothetical protein
MHLDNVLLLYCWCSAVHQFLAVADCMFVHFMHCLFVIMYLPTTITSCYSSFTAPVGAAPLLAAAEAYCAAPASTTLARPTPSPAAPAWESENTEVVISGKEVSLA